MSRTIMLVPIGKSVGVTSVSLGLVKSITKQGLSVNFFKPISQSKTDLERSTTTIQNVAKINAPESFSIEDAEKLISTNSTSDLLEEIVARFKAGTKDSDVVVVEGLVPNDKHQFANDINHHVAKTLNAEIVFVTNSNNETAAELKDRIESAASLFGGKNNQRIAGVIVNKVGAPTDANNELISSITELLISSKNTTINKEEVMAEFANSPLSMLGFIPWSTDLVAPRVMDLAMQLDATVVNEGSINARIKHIALSDEAIAQSDTMLVTASTDADIITAAIKNSNLSCIIIAGTSLPAEVKAICEAATDLSILFIKGNILELANKLQAVKAETPVDDIEKIEAVQDLISTNLDDKWLSTLNEKSPLPNHFSPAAFRSHLAELAGKNVHRVVLPEGDEPRTIEAAIICLKRKIAVPVLLGNPIEIKRVADEHGLVLPENIEMINPADAIEQYVAPMAELRKSKGLTEEAAREQLQDTVVLGTMMLAQDHVAGLVSGAVHSTASTIRPAMQLIKTAPGAKLISSIFFMLLPEQVLVYGDCAVNPNPTPDQIADIAIQAADSSKAFGIDPKVALLSYSTGTSGKGVDVESTIEASRVANELRPDLAIEGPIQYDAAVMKDVAKIKAPDSKVAGQATVFVFPDLKAANIGYKAVQRSADLVSIGPMLQGIRKPVNDLSRGALVDDIVYTIALTAIQATQILEKDNA